MAAPKGRDVILELLSEADVLVENFRTGVMEKFSFVYESQKNRFPKLVYYSISGYGREGSQKSRAAYDPIVQAESGQMATNGSAESGPMRTGLAVTDTQTGHFAVQGILAALFARERSGKGQYMESPCSMSPYRLCRITEFASCSMVRNYRASALAATRRNPSEYFPPKTENRYK